MKKSTFVNNYLNYYDFKHDKINIVETKSRFLQSIYKWKWGKTKLNYY